LFVIQKGGKQLVLVELTMLDFPLSFEYFYLCGWSSKSYQMKFVTVGWLIHFCL